jgi:iron complex transport system substrate-binding protein
LAITVLMTAAFAVSCKGGDQKAVEASEPVEMNLMEEAGLLRLYDRGDYYLAEVVNPWDTASVLKRYALVGHGVRPDSLPAGDVVRINIPLRRTVVYSSVHTGVIEELGFGFYYKDNLKLLEELGCDDAIVGVADGEYFNSDPMAGRISRGEVKNVGRSLSPSLEIIAGLSPDAILVSPFENAGHGVIEHRGLPL